MVNFYLIRHGWQNSPLCNANVGLSKEGTMQCTLLKERLKQYSIDALYSSDLIRAIETADIINEVFQLPHNIREGIREISFGLMEGNTEEYNEEHFKEFRALQLSLLEDIPYPEGENGLSVYKRAMPVLKEIIDHGYKNIVVVTHGGTIRALLAGLFGKDQAMRFLFGTTLINTGITQLAYNEKFERFYLERFNDHAHLEGYDDLLRKQR